MYNVRQNVIRVNLVHVHRYVILVRSRQRAIYATPHNLCGPLIAQVDQLLVKLAHFSHVIRPHFLAETVDVIRKLMNPAAMET
jgi:hypothetical protein